MVCIHIHVKNTNTRIYMFTKKNGNIGNTTPMKPVFIQVRACCRLFIENEVRIIEKDIERWLGIQLKKMGCIYMKFVSPGNDGVPDRIVVLPGGSVIFVELKAKKGVLMANQRIQVARLRKQGALVFVITGMIEAKLFVDDMERVIHELSSTRIPRNSHTTNH